MKSVKTAVLGLSTGLMAGFVLFVVGALMAMLLWKGAPPGKFSEEMIPPLVRLLREFGLAAKPTSPLYFLLTKLGFGMSLGVLYGFIHSRTARMWPTKRIRSGMLFGLLLWFVAAFPILPITLSPKAEIFWQVYTFAGLFAFGSIFGALRGTSDHDAKSGVGGVPAVQRPLKAAAISGAIMGLGTIAAATPAALIARVAGIKYFTVFEIASAGFVSSALLFSVAWGIVLVHVHWRSIPIGSTRVRYRALSLGITLWLVRWSFDVVHKICYSETAAKILLFNYIQSLVYLVSFCLVISVVRDKWRS